ncbi:MAG: phosphoglycerate mutase family protein [Pseudomonadota bacterium]|nr:phosphoglycerate mutase family protein [Pseudomonadota bacterium]
MPDLKNIKPNKNKRRLRFRLLPILFFVVLSVSLAWFLESQATTTIIFVKHADTQISLEENSDPSLSILGIERSILLANVLQDIDVIASVDEIYVDETARTIQTAEPLASRLDISPISRNPYEVDDFMREILSQHKGKIILVVTHSDIISDLIVELHGSKNIPIIERDEFDNIYIVTIPWFGKVKTLRLHYGLLIPQI